MLTAESVGLPVSPRPLGAQVLLPAPAVPPVIVCGPDGLPRMRQSHRLVFDVLLGRHRDHWADVTDVELQAALERLHAPRRFDRAWIAGRVSEMKAAGLLLESHAHRLSRNDVSGVKVRATYIPPGYRVPLAATASEDCY